MEYVNKIKNEFDKRAAQIDSCVIIPDETDILTKYAKEAKHGIVELGSLLGRSSVYLAAVANKNNIPMVCIDIWEDVEIFEQWQSNIKEFGLKVDCIKAGSTEPIKDVKCDVLFIDACHETVADDYNAWLPKLELPAIIMFHDIDNKKVRDLFDSIKNKKEEYGNIGVVFIPKKVKRVKE